MTGGMDMMAGQVDFDAVDDDYIQGFFLTGTPPKSSKYKKVNLG